MKDSAVRFSFRECLLSYLTAADILLIVFTIFLSVGLASVMEMVRTPGTIAIIEVNGHRIHRLDLNRDQTVTVQGFLGPVQLLIQDKKIRIVTSACPQKICIHSGARAKNGDVIVCVPNKVVVRITNAADDTLDLITG